MNLKLPQPVDQIMSGQARGLGASMLRLLTAMIEPAYRAVVQTRNTMFDRDLLHARRLPRPVISVGNLTTGGTGKTPVVQWLVRALGRAGTRPGVLLRGYRGSGDQPGDEEQLLRESLPGTLVVADPSRFRGGMRALQSDPAIAAFVLDDGFQHRKLHRDFDLVLVDALNPFGFGRILPRGMLREPPTSLRRGSAILITRTNLVEPTALAMIRRDIQKHAPDKPIFHCSHQLLELARGNDRLPINALAGQRVVGFCGLGNPRGFEQSLKSVGTDLSDFVAFPDHHAYDADDIAELLSRQHRSSAAMLVTTEKDWVKIARLPTFNPAWPIARAAVAVQFTGEDEAGLFQSILTLLTAA